MTETFHHPRIEMLDTSMLTPDPRNPRQHPEKQIVKLAGVIRRFGFLVPIVADGDLMILAGHGRLEAAKRLGLSEVPVIRAAFLTEADKIAFGLAENRLAELSSWDDDKLDEKLNILFEGGYDLDLTGFSTSDLDFAIVEKDPPKTDKRERVELPDPDAVAVSRVGDLWEAGDQRLYVGDARLVESWEALLGDERADMIVGDLPFNLRINGHVSGNGSVRHREFVAGSGEMTPGEFTSFLRAIFRNCVRFSRDGSIHYMVMDWRHCREILDAADGVYSQFKQLIVWVKNNGGQGAFYRSRHELIFVFKSGKAKHINNFSLGETGRYRTNVVEYAGCNTFRKGRDEDLAAHSTVKPTAMVVDFMLDCSRPGDLIVDPCLGSGTTLLAASRCRRRGAGIELDPLYADTALQRLAKATGLIPVLAGDGRTFDQIAAARRGELEG